MGLGSVTSKVLSMFKFWNQGLGNIEMSVIGFETFFDENNSLVYTYLLSVSPRHSPT
jgi:hypothetical protein